MKVYPHLQSTYENSHRLWALAILAADNNGPPVKDGKPLDPQNISDEDRPKLDGLIVDDVSSPLHITGIFLRNEVISRNYIDV